MVPAADCCRRGLLRLASLCTPVTALFVRQRIDQDHRLEHVVRRRLAEGLGEDAVDPAAAVKPRQRAIDQQAERAVVARQGERVGLVAEVLLAELEARPAALVENGRDDGAVGEIGVDLVVGQKVDAGAVIAAPERSSALRLSSPSDSRSTCSVVVPPSTPIRLPARSSNRLAPACSVRYSTLAPSRNVGSEKSTMSRRGSVTELGSQRISTLPSRTDSKRSSAGTSTNSNRDVVADARRARRRRPPGRDRRCSRPAGRSRCGRSRAWRRRGSRS